MTWVMFWVFPAALIVLAVVEHFDGKTSRARQALAAPVDTDNLDRLCARMLADDQFAETDVAWCAEFDIDWPTTAPAASLPMRPALPARPARHSRNRLHRGF